MTPGGAGFERSPLRRSGPGSNRPIRYGPCAGKPCVVEKADGTVEETRFPAEIAPHQPFLEVRALTHEVVFAALECYRTNRPVELSSLR